MEKKKVAERIRYETAREKEERMDLIFTKYVEYKYPLKILAQLWGYKFILRRYIVKGSLNSKVLYPYSNFNLVFDPERAIKNRRIIYLKRILFVVVHILYLGAIAYYDSFLYDMAMNHWLEEYFKYHFNTK